MQEKEFLELFLKIPQERRASVLDELRQIFNSHKTTETVAHKVEQEVAD